MSIPSNPFNVPLSQAHNSVQLNFTQPLLEWFETHGRKNLPWQHPKAPYTVWVSEIMLQQTQVKTVLSYFQRFMQRFPTIEALAKANEDTLFALWSGLGYYARARNLHLTAKQIVTQYQGQFPSDLDALMKLPGIGYSTAAAIMSLAFEQPAAILDGNVRRILSRYFMIPGLIQQVATKRTLQAFADACLSQTHPSDYTQAIMDLGALICTPRNPQCHQCPLQENCLAYTHQCVTHYPEKAPRKIKPEHTKQFLLLYHLDQQAFYFEKQPKKGIWGGLWSLPAFATSSFDLDLISNYLHKTHALQLKQHIKVSSFKHVFTHFKLQLEPHILIVSGNIKPSASELQSDWFECNDVSNVGLPKPIQKIIADGLSAVRQYGEPA